MDEEKREKTERSSAPMEGGTDTESAQIEIESYLEERPEVSGEEKTGGPETTEETIPEDRDPDFELRLLTHLRQRDFREFLMGEKRETVGEGPGADQEAGDTAAANPGEVATERVPGVLESDWLTVEQELERGIPLTERDAMPAEELSVKPSLTPEHRPGGVGEESSADQTVSRYQELLKPGKIPEREAQAEWSYIERKEDQAGEPVSAASAVELLTDTPEIGEAELCRDRKTKSSAPKPPLPPSLWQRLMAVVLCLGVILLGVLAWALPLRPSYSDSEKRALAAFPTLSIEAVLSGEYFSDMTTWFSDTFPLREQLLSGNAILQGLYGLKGEAVYGGEAVQEKETIPETAESLAPTMAWEEETTETAGEAAAAGDGKEIIAAAEAAEGETEAPAEPDPSFETDADGNLLLPQEDTADVNLTGEKAGAIYVVGDAAYELFYFSQQNMVSYASMLNSVQALLPETAVYCMIVPNSFGVMLDSAVQEKLASSGMDLAMDYTYSLMDPEIHRVSVYPALAEHRDEYIYFRTDHHWTQRGAYYAYLQFCAAKGLAPHALEDFERVDYDGFYGTFYFSTNRAEALKQHPDTIEAYLPMGTNDMTFLSQGGGASSAHVVNDGSALLPGSRYNTYLLGDNPYTEIVNPEINDGSAVLLIKESYGNAFAPFLVDHYQHVYVIDYRYYEGNLTEFMAEHPVQDILFLNNIMALGERTSRQMLGLFH